MAGIFSNGMYGYGRYGTAQYGMGEILLDTEIVTITDIISGIRVAVRDAAEMLDLVSVADVVTIKHSLQERNKIFINGNMLNGGIPTISYVLNTIPILKNIMNSIPTITKVNESVSVIKNITSGVPQFRRSLPYGY